MTTGAAHITLAAVAPDSRRQRLTALELVPTGASVLVDVGALPADPELIWAISDHAERIRVLVRGDASAVARWLAALKHGPGFSALALERASA
jgi:hypothetical protein